MITVTAFIVMIMIITKHDNDYGNSLHSDDNDNN